MYFFFILISSCSFGATKNATDTTKAPIKTLKNATIILGDQQTERYLPLLANKRVAIVGNQTSMIGKTHLVDSLLALGIQVRKVFAPEHGFRGVADNGEHISNETDKKSGLKIISLYGSHSKPTADQLADVDVVVYDIQDVGARFYTYLSTLHFVMEACAEQNKKLILLDRPNPNGHYIDGPVLEPTFTSFVGMHPVPIVYGMTIGEYATMINGEKWLQNNVTCSLEVIPCVNYTHSTFYSVPIPPSPNLQTDKSIAFYPSLCLFEGTTISVGRGTERPFEVYGHPKFTKSGFSFTPTPRLGSKNPPFLNQLCQGIDLSSELNPPLFELNIQVLIKAKKMLGGRDVFINSPSFFNKLAGNSTLKNQIENNTSEKEIRKSWQPGLDAFKKMRANYLLYPD